MKKESILSLILLLGIALLSQYRIVQDIKVYNRVLFHFSYSIPIIGFCWFNIVDGYIDYLKTKFILILVAALYLFSFIYNAVLLMYDLEGYTAAKESILWRKIITIFIIIYLVLLVVSDKFLIRKVTFRKKS